jgi:replicative DNA helicase
MKSKTGNDPRLIDTEDAKVYANVEYERFLLGSVIAGNRESEEALRSLLPGMFFMRDNATIFQAMIEMRDARKDIDTISLCEHISERSSLNTVGGLAYVTSLSDGLPVVHSLSNYIASIQRNYRLRKCQRFAATLNAMLQSGSTPEEQFLKEACEGSARLLREVDLNTDIGKTFWDAGVELICSLDKRKSVRVTTGIIGVDDKTGGFLPGELVVLTADTGVGKTILAQQCRRNACAQGWHTLYCSGEMVAHHLMAREVAAEADVPQWKMRVPEKLHRDEQLSLLEAAGHLCKQCRVLDRELTLVRIGTAARAMKQKSGLDLLVLDYDELIEVPGKDEWEQQKTLTRAAKWLAIELDCVCILISQLRKTLQGEDSAKPRLQSLYGSGAKAKHASIVLYVDRQFVRDLEGDETAAKVFVLKSRDGRVGFADCVFNVKTLRFENPKQGLSSITERSRKDPD